MPTTGTLSLELLDVYGRRIDDRVDLVLKHTVLPSATRVARNIRAHRRLRLPLDAAQGGTYSLAVYPMLFRPVARFVQIQEGQDRRETIVFAVDPERVLRIEAPTYDALPADVQNILVASTETEGYPVGGGRALYEALDDVRRSGLLNLIAKTRQTVFPSGRSVLTFVSALRRIRGDRIFAHVRKELRDEVKSSVPSGLFHAVEGALHTPPPDYTRAGSFKTHDRYGNLQLTFFVHPDTLDSIVDADIDDAGGIGHVFQVLAHAIARIGTHPYDIHELLVRHQFVDPGYRLITTEADPA